MTHPVRATSESAAETTTATPSNTLVAVAAVSFANAAERYELLTKIAHGGMGHIYRAHDKALGREVAVKVLQEKFGSKSAAGLRFADEARIAAQLQHPGIPPVHDFGTLPDGRPFLAMKLIKGQTLDQLLAARTNPAAERGRFVAVFEQVCQALAYAHAHDVIHRDLKPANIMVGAFAEVQVMDWGLAKVLGAGAGPASDPLATTAETEMRPVRGDDDWLTQAGSMLGTPAYIPPEQAIGAIDQIDARSDVFGLGGVLAVILTGRPPFQGDTGESTRQLSALGKVHNCFARLDRCGADPELVALCKRCLSPDKADRPRDASEVAGAVAALRAAADDRARQAELERVKAEGEKVAAEAQSLERRKRRRLWLGAAAALVLAVLAGLGAVLAVQRRANDVLAAKNAELAAEQAKVQARFELAQKAIAAFHTGVSEDVLLKNEQFRELRTRLLTEAAGFYGDLEKLLAGQTDRKSRQMMAAGYFQLAELTDKIGSKRDALEIHRKALAVRRELAAGAGADVETRLDVALSLSRIGALLSATGKQAEALATFQEQRDLATALAAESPLHAVAAVLAQSYHSIGEVEWATGKPAAALADYQKAESIQQKLAEASPGVRQFQADLALTHKDAAIVLSQTGKSQEGLAAFEKARQTWQKLADAYPDITDYRRGLAASYNGIGIGLGETGKVPEALAAFDKAREIRQKLADANPSVNRFQADLALIHHNISWLLARAGKPDEALAAVERAREIAQRLVAANPAVTEYQMLLAMTENNIALRLSMKGKAVESLAAYEKARAIWQKLADANATVTKYRAELALTLNNMAVLLLERGKTAESLAAYEKALAVRQKLVDANPGVTKYPEGLAQVHDNIGDLLSWSGKPAAALAAFEKALTIRQNLVDANPAVSDFQVDLAGLVGRMGLVYARQGEFRKAFEFLDRSIVAGQRLLAKDSTVPEYSKAVGSSLIYRGWARIRAGKPADAVADLKRGIELKARDPDPRLRDRFERSWALAILAGLGRAANSGVTTAEAAGVAGQAVASLQDAVRAGWRQLDQLRGADFDPLRQRADFQELVKELEAVSDDGVKSAARPEPGKK